MDALADVRRLLDDGTRFRFEDQDGRGRSVGDDVVVQQRRELLQRGAVVAALFPTRGLVPQRRQAAAAAFGQPAADERCADCTRRLNSPFVRCLDTLNCGSAQTCAQCANRHVGHATHCQVVVSLTQEGLLVYLILRYLREIYGVVATN